MAAGLYWDMDEASPGECGLFECYDRKRKGLADVMVRRNVGVLCVHEARLKETSEILGRRLQVPQ